MKSAVHSLLGIFGAALFVVPASAGIDRRTPLEGGTTNSGVARENMVPIPAGSHAPLLRGKDEPDRVPVAAFWLDRGVDGFRLDALNFGMHDPALTDNPPVAEPGKRTRPFDFQHHFFTAPRSKAVAKRRTRSDNFSEETASLILSTKSGNPNGDGFGMSSNTILLLAIRFKA